MRRVLRRLQSHLSHKERALVLLASLLAGALLGALVLAFPRPFERLDEELHRVWLSRRNAKITASEIGSQNTGVVVVGIDDATAEAYGWPLPREAYAEIVRRLELAGAKTIGLDLIFTKKGPDAAGDASLAETLANPKVILPYALVSEEEGDKSLGRVGRKLPYGPLTKAWKPHDFEKRLGFSTVPGDDETVRAVWLKVQELAPGSPVYYAWPVMMLAHFEGVTPEEVVKRVRAAEFVTFVLDLEARVVEAWVNLPGRGMQAKRFHSGQAELSMLLTEVSVKDLLEVPEDQLPGLFSSKKDPFMAVVGVTMKGGVDMKQTLVGMVSGPEIQACTLINLRLNNFLLPPSTVEMAMGALGGALIIGFLGGLLNFRATLAAVGLCLVTLVVASHELVAGGSPLKPAYLAPFFTPLFGIILGSIFVLVAQLWFEHHRVNKVVGMFKEVCPVHNLEELLEGQGLRLGGEERELTILFSDLRGYTSFAEQLDSVTVLNVLNEYFGAVGHIFERFGGFVFDYQGDAQMVVFGLVAASQPNHAAAACRAGAAMVAELESRREQWLQAGQAVPETGVGICTGKVSFGVLGTAQHKQYVAIGDPTNTASRVQGKSAELDFPVLLTESTVLSAGGVVPVQPLEKIVLKGKKDPLQVYGLKMAEMLDQIEHDADGKLAWFFKE